MSEVVVKFAGLIIIFHVVLVALMVFVRVFSHRSNQDYNQREQHRGLAIRNGDSWNALHYGNDYKVDIRKLPKLNLEQILGHKVEQGVLVSPHCIVIPVVLFTVLTSDSVLLLAFRIPHLGERLLTDVNKPFKLCVRLGGHL
jgi:hypothetical protein